MIVAGDRVRERATGAEGEAWRFHFSGAVEVTWDLALGRPGAIRPAEWTPHLADLEKVEPGHKPG